MKKKISVILLSAVLIGVSAACTLSVFAEDLTEGQTEKDFQKAQKRNFKIGKITEISENSILVALAEKPEKEEKDFNEGERTRKERPEKSEESEKKERPEKIKEPEDKELILSGETIEAEITDSVKIKTDSEDSDISSLKEGDIVRLIYDDNGELIEISIGKMKGGKLKNEEVMQKGNFKLGKITEISENSILVALAEKPEKEEKDFNEGERTRKERPEKSEESEKKERPEKIKEPEDKELILSEETIEAEITDLVKIKTDSEDSDISSLKEGDIVRLIYDDNDELIEISTGKVKGRDRHDMEYDKEVSDDL